MVLRVKKTKIAMTSKKVEALGAAKRGDRYKATSKKEKDEFKKEVEKEKLALARAEKDAKDSPSLWLRGGVPAAATRWTHQCQAWEVVDPAKARVQAGQVKLCYGSDASGGRFTADPRLRQVAVARLEPTFIHRATRGENAFFGRGWLFVGRFKRLDERHCQ